MSISIHNSFKNRIKLQRPSCSGFEAFRFSSKPEQPGLSNSIGLETVLINPTLKIIVNAEQRKKNKKKNKRIMLICT